MTQASAPSALDVPRAAANEQSPRVGKGAWLAGWILSAIPILLMGVLGTGILLFKRTIAEEGNAKYGYPPGVTVPLLIVEIICVILYAIPQTAVLGAILLTGYLGGAVATHVRAGEPWFFPVIVGVLIWLGLVLRDPRLRALILLRKA
jgi:hypothetical protein